MPVALAACTSPGAATAAAEASAVCPESLSAAIGVACTTDGLACPLQYPCGIVPAIATCTCTGGVFACTDVVGRSLDDGGSPRCPPPLVQGACPSTEAIASQHVCNEVLLTCPYIRTCADAQTLDQCECVRDTLSDGQAAMHFNCPAPCDYTPLVDAGANEDATIGEASAGDAPSESRAADATGG
jgi:hypothetical protein